MLICCKIIHLEHEFLWKEIIVISAYQKDVLKYELILMVDICEIFGTK